MKKAWMKYVAVGLGVYLLLMLYQLPASIVYWMFESQIKANPQIAIYGLKGSVWQGEMERLDINRTPYYGVKWQLHPMSIFSGKLSATASYRNADSSAVATVARSLFGSWVVSDVNMRMPAQQLISMARLPAIKLDGQFNVKLDSFKYDGKTVKDAEGVVVWNAAASRFPQSVELGDLKAQLANTDNGIEVMVSDSGGPLEIKGKVELDEQANYNVDLSMKAREGLQSNLGRSLRMMGPVNARGEVAIKQKGNLQQFAFLMPK